MGVHKVGFLISVIAGFASTAQAQTVAQYVSAKVSGSQTIDTAGIFGAPGVNLSGKVITIFAQYRPADFAVVTPCGPGCSLYFNKSNTATVPQTTRNFYVPNSTLIVVSLNDQHVAFAPSMLGSVEILNNTSGGDTGNSIGIGSDFVNFAQTETYPGCQVSFVYPSAVSFGSALSPTNTPSAQGGSIAFFKPALQPGGQKLSETLTFTVDQAKR